MKTQHDSSVTQAVSGDVTAAATDRPTCVAGGIQRTDPPAEAVAVIEPPKPDDLPVAAGSDEIQRLEGEMRFILMSIRKALGIEHDEGIGIVPTIEALIESNNDWRKTADALDVDKTNLLQAIYTSTEQKDDLHRQLSEWTRMGSVYGVATPQEMFDAIQRRNFTINEQNEQIDKLEGEIKRLDEEVTDLQNDLIFTPLPASTAEADMVNHPSHYQGKVECIDAIESALGPERFAAFCRGNAMKYIFRAGRKGDEAEDLAKAAWYLQRIGQ